MKNTKNQNEHAVSPVVGVMLMLVVTIIIAAVVSAFAGGSLGSTQKSPVLTMDAKITNAGTWCGSGFTATVTSVSDAIPSKNLKIVTSWTTTNKTANDGSYINGGSTSVGGVSNFQAVVGSGYGQPTGIMNNSVPWGFGPGAGDPNTQNPTMPQRVLTQQFGNYSLLQGTGLYTIPAGYPLSTGLWAGCSAGAQGDSYGYGVVTPYTYTTGGGTTGYDSGQTDAVQAVLGSGWENLRAGDTVKVKVIYTPSGQTIFQKTVTVTGG